MSFPHEIKQDIKRVLVVGGGFGGVASALTFAKKHLPHAAITLVSDKPHFEYKPMLYRVVTGRSPLEVCIPLKNIFAGKNIEFAVDVIDAVDLEKKIARGTSGTDYPFDYLVLALGSETAYFNIPGLEKFSFGFKSISEAMRLKAHLHALFSACKNPAENLEGKVCLLQVVVVGAGPSGVELAGELAVFMKRLAKKYDVDASLVSVDLIEAAPRILPALPERVARKVVGRLRRIGVNIFTNRAMTEEQATQIKIRGMTMKTETVVWASGVKPNKLYKKIDGLKLDETGRVVTDEYLRASGHPQVFAIGDGAVSIHGGMAQTALHQGEAVADNITRLILDKPPVVYKPRAVYHLLPVGPGWAAAPLRVITLYGFLGWLLRRAADIRYFLTILPFSEAMRAFRRHQTLCETCGICEPQTKP